MLGSTGCLSINIFDVSPCTSPSSCDSYEYLLYSLLTALKGIHYISASIILSDHDQPSSQFHRGVRRRSLVFERSENHERNSICESKGSSSVAIQSDNIVAPTDNQLVQIKNGSSSISKLPGIGLHLSALASTNDGKIVKLETRVSESQLISTPKMTSYNSLTPNEVPQDICSSQNSLETALVPWDDEDQVLETAYRTSECLVGEEFDHGSPRKKRHAQNNFFSLSF